MKNPLPKAILSAAILSARVICQGQSNVYSISIPSFAERNGLSTAQAAPCRTIHNWTVRTPLGDFGWLEIGSDEASTERYFLFGQFGYLTTRATAPVVIIMASVILSTIGCVGFSLLRPRQAHKNSQIINPAPS